MHAGTKGLNQRRSDELLDSLTAGDRLIVSELSRLGRSRGAGDPDRRATGVAPQAPAASLAAAA